MSNESIGRAVGARAVVVAESAVVQRWEREAFSRTFDSNVRFADLVRTEGNQKVNRQHSGNDQTVVLQDYAGRAPTGEAYAPVGGDHRLHSEMLQPGLPRARVSANSLYTGGSSAGFSRHLSTDFAGARATDSSATRSSAQKGGQGVSVTLLPDNSGIDVVIRLPDYSVRMQRLIDAVCKIVDSYGKRLSAIKVNGVVAQT